MSIRGRRWLNVAGSVLGALVIAGAAMIVGFAGDTERITSYWTSAELDSDGSATVFERIEYDFGSNSRHGIYRDVPDLELERPIVVSSDTAPAEFVVQPNFPPRIRIGDPNRTIRGRHVYEITYGLDTLVTGTTVSWNAVGTEWTVPLDDVEIHLTAPFELLDATCSKGRFGASGGCTARVVEPGHLRVVVDSLDGSNDDWNGSEGVTVSARGGAPVPLPAAPSPPTEPAPDPGASILSIGLAALVGSLVLVPIASVMIKRRGREQVWAGGPADAAFGPGDVAAGEPRAVVRLDAEELARMTTIEFVPPDGIEPWQGGVIDREKVRNEHLVAWLVQRAIEGQVTLTGDDDPVIEIGPAGLADPALAVMFGGRSSIELGKRDAKFRKAWAMVRTQQEHFARTSTLWDPRGSTARLVAIAVGLAGLVVGLVIGGFGSVLAVRQGSGWLTMIGVGAAIAGAGLTAVIRAWELRVRSPIGSAQWLKVDSFRQFLAGSEAEHAEWAAENGLLREYTAWAVALDEIDHWSKAVAESSVATTDPSAYYLAVASSRLGSATTAASASESSSGGGGGGSVGGGGGGGGGGSW